jgi:hypothetical protein
MGSSSYWNIQDGAQETRNSEMLSSLNFPWDLGFPLEVPRGSTKITTSNNGFNKDALPYIPTDD